MKLNPKCIDATSGHLWVRAHGFVIELWQEKQDNWSVWDIYKRDSAGQLASFVGYVKLDPECQVVYSVFYQAVVPSRFYSLRAAVAWVKFASNEGKGFRYL